MKTFYIIIFLGVALIGKLFSQTIPNGNFENWTLQTFYEEPVNYLSTNGWVFGQYPGGNVTKVTSAYHGLYAAQLTTIQTSTDTMFGGLFIGTPGNQTVNGGLPYSGQPDSISAYVKYNIQTNDTGYFIVAFKKNGVMIGMTVKTFTGIQTSYQRFAISSNLPVNPAPDSIVVIISSSRLDPPRFAGSTLTIDSISMIGSTQIFPNPSFENWNSLTSEEPDNWTTINYASTGNPSATKSTSSMLGSFALRIETVSTTWGDNLGFVTNGYLGPNGPTGGMQVLSNPQKITGYYKYFPVGNDTALGAAFSYINGAMVDSSMIQFTAQINYTYFEIPLSYNAFPYVDTLNISFASSNMNDSNYTGVGSVLFIDNLNLVYLPVGIIDQENFTDDLAYPNPFNDLAIIAFNNNEGLSYDICLFDLSGRIVRNYSNVTTSNIVIHRDNLPAGMYEYRISSSKTKTIVAKGKLVAD